MPRTQYTLNLFNSISWLTQSKALEKSKNDETTEYPVSRLSYMICKVLIIASEVDNFFFSIQIEMALLNQSEQENYRAD